MNTIDSHINSRDFKKAYIIFGEEKYLTLEYEKKLREAIVPKEAELMNLSVFEGISDANSVAEAAETMPFFNDYRLIVIKNSGILKTGNKELTEGISKILNNSPETTIFLFCGEEVDKRNSLYKLVKKIGYVWEIKYLKNNELTKWLISQSDNRLSQSSAAYLVDCVGNSMEALSTELNKAMVYSGKDKITNEIIDKVCSKSPEVNMFNMIDALGAKNSAKALDIYNNMLIAKESPLAVLAMISRQFKYILQCKYMLKKNYTKSQIAFELSLRDFAADKYIRQSNNFTISRLMEALKDCADLDVRFKQGLISDKLGVEMIILKYSK